VLIVQAQALLDVDHPSTLILPLTTNLIDDAEPCASVYQPNPRFVAIPTR